jgi:RNA polymerase sigma-70 factor (ECF subfamily)
MDEVARLDVSVFDERYPELFADLRRLCRALGGADDSDDLAQDAMLAGRARLHQLRDDNSLVPWLRKIAARRVSRARGVRRLVPFADRAEATANEFATVDLSLDEQVALTRLPKRQRQLVALVYFAGSSQAVAAEMLDISRGTVASTLWDARASLARSLRVHGPQGGGGQ